MKNIPSSSLSTQLPKVQLSKVTQHLKQVSNVVKQSNLNSIIQDTVSNSIKNISNDPTKFQGLVIKEQAVKKMFGISLKKATMGIMIGVGIAIAGYYIYKGIKYYIFKKQQPNNPPNNNHLVASHPIDHPDFHCPQLPQHDQISQFSSALTISSKQIKQVQQAYLCQISFTLMVDPVIGLCCKKRHYQKIVIQAWIEQKRNCPYCKKQITKEDLLQLSGLKIAIKLFKKQLAKRAKKMEKERIKQDGLDDEQLNLIKLK